MIWCLGAYLIGAISFLCRYGIEEGRRETLGDPNRRAAADLTVALLWPFTLIYALGIFLGALMGEVDE